MVTRPKTVAWLAGRVTAIPRPAAGLSSITGFLAFVHDLSRGFKDRIACEARKGLCDVAAIE